MAGTITVPKTAVATAENPGQWPVGKSGNPKGRPKDVRTISVLKNNLELAVREKLHPKTVTAIVNRMVDIALKDPDPEIALKAGKEILSWAVSKAAVQESQSHDRPAIHIVIENATLNAAKQHNEPIEVKYDVVSGKENQ